MRDELWFIEFGRGAALPLTPEEAPVDGEPVVPCAQGRIIVETARPAPPYFATCSTYRRHLLSRKSNEVSASLDRTQPSSSSVTQQHQQHRQQQYQQQRLQYRQQSVGGKGAVSKSTIMPQSPAARPEDLSVTPWYLEDQSTIDTSPGPMDNRSSYPSHSYSDKDSRLDLNSMKDSSIESEFPKALPVAPTHRKAYMDLKDAMALLDETCPNVEPSPSLSPRTPRTPQTPYLRNKRARSKSSDNSSIYSNDQLSNRSFETSKEKKRPFLKKIGISRTEDRSFLAKLAPRIIGKPYLEKIGPSKAVERPFLDKIGSSKTLDKFTFDTPRNARRNEVKRETKNNMIKKDEINHGIEQTAIQKNIGNTVQNTATIEAQRTDSEKSQATFERRRSGKEFLLKMYSFETEDLESIIPTKEHRKQLRGSSMDDILDSVPSSTENDNEEISKPPKQGNRPNRMTELLKCRVTTSEEIIFSTTCLDSPSQASTSSWTNSPRRVQRLKMGSTTPTHRKILQASSEVLRSDSSIPNSPTKRPISNISSDREIESRNSKLGTYSPTKTRKSNVENIVDREIGYIDQSIKRKQFERRGISSDNLLAKDTFSFITAARNITDNIGRTREISSEVSLATVRGAQEYTKETFKQLQDKFRSQEIPMETYADFKRRIRAAQGITNRHQLLQMSLLPKTPDDLFNKITAKTENAVAVDTNFNQTSEIKNQNQNREGRRSILRKQERIDHSNNQEPDMNSSIRRPKRRIFHEPSQETMDLLTELRKVKSLLKTPSWEKDLDLDQKPIQMPKRILLTDKEFCLSVERENSVRRPSKVVNLLNTTEEGKITFNQGQEGKEGRESNSGAMMSSDQKIFGPALFEKKCLSLDYADEEKSQRMEIRSISVASTRNLTSKVEETDDYHDLTKICDSKSYSSDVFNSPPSEETNEKVKDNDLKNEQEKKPIIQNHCAEVDIAIPIDQKINNPKEDIEIQGRTSDLYEIISPRSTPFRVKKRLGKISIEETVKPENFTLGSKVDCRSVISKKGTKCRPL